MKGAKEVLSFCQSASEQERLFQLSACAQRLHTRVAKLAREKQLVAISAQIRECGGKVDQSMDALECAAATLEFSFLSDCVAQEAGAYSESALYNATAKTIVAGPFAGVILYEDEGIRLSLMSLSPMGHKMKRLESSGRADQGVTVQGADSVIRFLRSGDATLRIWEADPFDCNHALEQRRLPECLRQQAQDGEAVRLIGGRHAMSVEQTEGPMLFIMATSLRPRVSVNVHYREDGTGIHSFTAADMASSRIQLLATMLRELDQCGFDALVKQLQHEDHFVRWHIMREMLAMDVQRSTPLLRGMANTDPHPQVREAAKRVLDSAREEEKCRA